MRKYHIWFALSSVSSSFWLSIIVWYPWNLRGLSEQFLMPMSKRSVNMESSLWFFEEPFFSKPPTLDYHLHANWMDPPEEKNRFVRPWWPVSNMMTYLKLWDYSATSQGFLRYLKRVSSWVPGLAFHGLCIDFMSMESDPKHAKRTPWRRINANDLVVFPVTFFDLKWKWM